MIMDTQQLYMPVNWVDGMKINKTHLEAERNALQQQAVFAAGSHITSINYGLLAPVTSLQESCRVFVSLDNQQHVQVRLAACRAITPGGAVIHIDEQPGAATVVDAKVPGLSVPFAELKNTASVYYILLTANIFNRVPAGLADPGEIPPRLPYSLPQYSLSLVPQEGLNGSRAGLYQVTLGRVLVNENRIEVDENYIPPCVTVAAHPDLREVFYGLEEFMGKMELYSMQIVQKIQQKKQSNEMALIVQWVCNNILQHQNMHFTWFRWAALHQPPAFMLSMTASLARLIKNSLDVYVNTGREELMNYFVEWCELSQGALDTVITDLANHNYQHEDINAAVIKVLAFTKTVSALFLKLSKLDYIGKKKEAAIFVKEEIVNPTETAESTAKKRRNFLAD
jgi:hypothetical protein